MSRAAIYIRVSTREQAEEGYSLVAQEKILRSYCDQRGHTVVDVYADEGVSAKDIRHRPALRRLLDDVTARKIDVVLVWKLTRFSRSVSDLCSMCDLLERHDIALVSLTEAFDGATPTGRMIRNILGVIAQFEREVISENVKLGMAERAALGKRTCSYVLGYDYDKEIDRFIVNRSESRIVRFIFDSYLEHRNLLYVSKLCEKKGYSGKMGGRLKAENVRKILTRPIYCGFNSFNSVPYKGNHKAIITIEQYNLVQEIMERSVVGRPRKHKLIKLPT